MVKSLEEIDKMRQSAIILSKAHGEVAKWVKPGVSTLRLDKIAEEFILDNNSLPAFKGYEGYRYTICSSVNDTICHGHPSTYEIKETDVVSIDCGVIYKGMYSDSAYTYTMCEVPKDTLGLVTATQNALILGINQAKAGNCVGDISNAIQSYIEPLGYGIVREFTGHGIGKNLHELPSIPNIVTRGNGQLLKAGMTLAIEPIINLVTPRVKFGVRTADGKPSAHFEHTILITDTLPEILTSFKHIQDNFQ